jgi:hypothetical protein
MVNMVKTDVAAKPLQYFGEFIERTPPQCRIIEIPIFVACPIHSFVLMLDVEEPDTKHAGNPNCWEKDENKACEPDSETNGRDQDGQGYVRVVDVFLFPGSGRDRGEPVRNEKHEQRSDAEHYYRISIEAINETLPGSSFSVLLHSEHPDISDSSPVQIASRRVMKRVVVPPFVIRSKREESAHDAHNVVCTLGFEKGSVAAIVKNNEGPYLKSRSQQSKREREPVRDVQASVHQIRKNEIGTERIDDLPHAAAKIWVLIFGNRITP